MQMHFAIFRICFKISFVTALKIIIFNKKKTALYVTICNKQIDFMKI